MENHFLTAFNMISEIDNFNYLLEALKTIQIDFMNFNQKMMGFLIGGLAWILISDKTREFLKNRHVAKWLTIVLLSAGYISHVYSSLNLFTLSNNVKDEILKITNDNFKILPAYYESYLIYTSEILDHLIMSGILTLVIVGMILSLKSKQNQSSLNKG